MCGLAKRLRLRWTSQFMLTNDTRTLTIAEQHFGISRSRQNVVLVTIGRGVGMGAVVNGELLRGHRDIGAEFGHITMALDGPLCPCGKRGCSKRSPQMLGSFGRRLRLASPRANRRRSRRSLRARARAMQSCAQSFTRLALRWAWAWQT